MDKALNIKNLRKTYRTGTVAVDGISLEIEKGAFFGFLGPNGAGKSTTIHCVTGIARFNEGTIKIFGVDVVKDYKEARRKIGLSPQEFNVDIFATTEQILDWVGGFYGIPKKERKQRIEYLIERFNLKNHSNKKFRELSGGLKRRVMLARAMVHDPELLILDEPTAGVDVELRHELWQFLRELNEEGKTILLTSHYLEEVELLCDTIAIISDGKIVANDKKERFISNGNKLEQIYLELTKSKEHE